MHASTCTTRVSYPGQCSDEADPSAFVLCWDVFLLEGFADWREQKGRAIVVDRREIHLVFISAGPASAPRILMRCVKVCFRKPAIGHWPSCGPVARTEPCPSDARDLGIGNSAV